MLQSKFSSRVASYKTFLAYRKYHSCFSLIGTVLFQRENSLQTSSKWVKTVPVSGDVEVSFGA